MQGIIDEVDNLIYDNCITADCKFSVSDVRLAIGKLKPHKSDGDQCLYTGHFINAGMIFLYIYHYYLVLLLYMVELLVVYVLVLVYPFPKDVMQI